MTKFSFEVPLKHLNDFLEDQDFIFALSILTEHQVYKDFLTNVRPYKTIWMDNSFNETFQAEDSHKLAWLYRMYKPVRVISPDSPTMSTVEIVKHFRDLKSHLVDVGDIIVVVRDWTMYTELADVAQNFAVSYHVRGQNFTYDDLKEIPKIHFLGLINPYEVDNCKPASCDTSMPVKLAKKGWTMEYWCDQDCPHIHTKDLGYQGNDFFNTVMTTSEIDLAKMNINWLKNYVNGGK